MPQIIYTWRDLQLKGDGRRFDIRWTWSAWDHTANEREHFAEAEAIWRKILPERVIKPVLRALNEDRLQDCQSDLQRFAHAMDPQLRRVFGLPRVLFVRSFPIGNQQAEGTVVMIFVTYGGVISVIKKSRIFKGFELTTIYICRTLVKGLALFPDYFEQNAVQNLVETYTRCSAGKLPSKNDPRHFVKRRYEVDRQLKFIKPQNWGFDSDQPGAHWTGNIPNQ